MSYTISSIIAGAFLGEILLGTIGAVICSIGLMSTNPRLIGRIFSRFGFQISFSWSEKAANIIIMLTSLFCNIVYFGFFEISMRKNFIVSGSYHDYANDRVVNWLFCSLFLTVICNVMYRMFYSYDSCLAYVKKITNEISPIQEQTPKVHRLSARKIKLRILYKLIVSAIFLPAMCYGQYDALNDYFNGVFVGGRITRSFYNIYQYEILIIAWITAINYTISICLTILIDSVLLIFNKHNVMKKHLTSLEL